MENRYLNFEHKIMLSSCDLMVLGKFKEMIPKMKKEEEASDEYLELSEDTKSDGKIGVKIETLSSYADTDRIQQVLREGNVVFLNIKELRAKDISELKKSVDKLRKTCTAMDGDIVGVEEEFLIITPQHVQIYRGRTE